MPRPSKRHQLIAAATEHLFTHGYGASSRWTAEFAKSVECMMIDSGPPEGAASPIGDQAQTDSSCAVAGGSISVPGWKGTIDHSEQSKGESLKEAKLSKDGATLHVITGPAIAYGNPADKATGNYTVKATFTEPKYMNLNTHPHPYGLLSSRATI